MNYQILVCDDDKDILTVLKTYLVQDGYQVVCAENGRAALDTLQASQHDPDGLIHLIILDVMMPMLDGIQAAVKIREFSNVPIIFLSAKTEDTDRILGLNMGGDDYISKPFNTLELLARVKAALRRYARLGGLDGPPVQKNTANSFRTGDLLMDDELKRVTLDGQEVVLTALEYNILRLLMSNMDRVFSSAQIYEAVWDEPAWQVPKTVSVHIRHIREKIEINPKEPQYLKVIYGLGYKVVKLS
jgi:DNA-binding response OmpR family regulator